MAAMQRHWDIFCRVIDNFGDIGVCWRLARQLVAEHGLAVRLWVDDPAVLAALCPAFMADKPEQIVDGVEVRQWREPFPNAAVADVVVEAFACDLPDTYLQAMAGRNPAPCWINLEYLSAEPWVEGCHGMASPHPTLPLVKHFFFPGFTAGTGGLLREADLLARRDACSAASEGPLQVSLFCYDTAPVGELLEEWAAGERPVRCLVPPGKPLAVVKHHLGEQPWQKGNLEIVAIPFVPQADFDRLLWQCDINFVRGEDSFVRAQWAAKPFVWQIYPQHDEVHLVKLDAFLDRYVAGLPPVAASAVIGLFHAWNGGSDLVPAWRSYLEQRALLAEYGHQWVNFLGNLGSLAGNLVRFCGTKI